MYHANMFSPSTFSLKSFFSPHKITILLLTPRLHFCCNNRSKIILLLERCYSLKNLLRKKAPMGKEKLRGIYGSTSRPARVRSPIILTFLFQNFGLWTRKTVLEKNRRRLNRMVKEGRNKKECAVLRALYENHPIATLPVSPVRMRKHS